MVATPTIFWFRRDLRLADNPALIAAATASGGDVVPAFIVDPTFAAPAGPARVLYLRRTLESLAASMDDALTVRTGEPGEQLLKLAREVGATAIYATGDYGPRGRERDTRVARELGDRGLRLQFVDSPYIVAPGTVVTKAGSPCRVFSAYRRGWEVAPPVDPLPAPEGVEWRRVPSESLEALSRVRRTKRPWYFGDLSDEVPAHPVGAGESAALAHLRTFALGVDDYDVVRNLPGADATSRLSPFLRFGSLHPRQVLHALGGPSPGRVVFRSELCWRDFYADVLFHHPDSVWRVLQPSLQHLRVDTDARAVERFQSWARGQTGYPMVDAGMRQLLSEGWMHNRVRMVAASFLVKHLHLDWRWGAKWFMWRLIDGDLSSNQHGWQWTAGTGTDAAPFHRIFNPTSQAQRFDPDGTYVRRFVPELSAVLAPQCLLPGGGDARGLHDYVAPIIDIASERREALARFSEARQLARVLP